MDESVEEGARAAMSLAANTSQTGLPSGPEGSDLTVCSICVWEGGRYILLGAPTVGPGVQTIPAIAVHDLAVLDQDQEVAYVSAVSYADGLATIQTATGSVALPLTMIPVRVVPAGLADIHESIAQALAQGQPVNDLDLALAEVLTVRALCRLLRQLDTRPPSP